MVPNKVFCEIFGDEIYYKIKMKTRRIEPDIRSNIMFKNTQEGRCFILGNGPSLNDVELKRLENEFIFTCNNFSKVKNFEDAKTNVHAWVDEVFFGARKEFEFDKAIIEEGYKKIATQNPICFLPKEARPYIEEHGFNDILNIHYLDIFEFVQEDRHIHYDIASGITGFHTVVQYEILIAIYMGFKEIYLLGCDETGVLGPLNQILGVEPLKMHAYDNDNIYGVYEEILKKWRTSGIFRDFYHVFLAFKKIYDLCQELDVKLINLSTRSLVTEIPRMNLNDVLS